MTWIGRGKALLYVEARSREVKPFRASARPACPLQTMLAPHGEDMTGKGVRSARAGPGRMSSYARDVPGLRVCDAGPPAS